MRILAVDDERLALAALCSAIEEAVPDAQTDSFRTAAQALAAAREQHYDIAFIDIDLRGESGMTLARDLRDLDQKTGIVFVTGYADYAVDAFTLHANGYILKPASPERIREEVDALFERKTTAENDDKRVRLQCFGNFEAFIDDVPVNFKYRKTRELLACLADRRGAICTNREIMAVLWEDEQHDAYLRRLKKDLVDTLAQKGCEDVLVRRWGGMALAADKVSCDYYDWRRNGDNANKRYTGEYMSQYSWAESTKALLRRGQGTL